jgi:hypothetical protein
MKIKNLMSLLLTLTLGPIQAAVIDEDSLEVNCSKALLAEMQKKQLITNSSGVCLQSLTDLPQVNIGLGSSVYDLGVASGNSIGKEDVKIKLISKILTGNEFNKTKFEVYGFADGRNNTSPKYTDVFLGEKNTFKKIDVRTKIKDAPTRAKILELLDGVEEKTEIQSIRSDGTRKDSFNKEPGVTYHPNIERVMSLVNNYYLSIDRAAQTCLQLAGTDEELKHKCERSVSGHASPNSEVMSSGKITCDDRRKAVLVLNPGVKAAKTTDQSRVQPNFQIPTEGESRRDMQLSSTLDLFKKIASAPDSDPGSVIEKLATDCSGNPMNQAAKNFNQDNLKRMHNDIQALMANVSDAKLKTAIVKGDYKTVKKYVEQAESDLADGLVTKEDPTQKLLSSLIYGVDTSKSAERLKFQSANGTNKKIMNCAETKDPDLKKYEVDYAKPKVFECTEISADQKKLVRYFVSNPRKRTEVFEIDARKVWQQTYNGSKVNYSQTRTLSNTVTYGDPDYPNASWDDSSSDKFNCLSASAAIEEKLSNQNQTGAGGELIDPYDLYPDANGNVKVSINAGAIPTHEGYNGEITKGWICDRCHSGLKVEKDAKQVNTINRKSRETVMTNAGTQSQLSSPLKSMGLTFGSMKSLGFRKVTRESFNGQCEAPKKVCDCLKNSGKYGGLDKILTSSGSSLVNLTKDLKADMPMPEGDLKNSCLYTPPVAHGCSVAPSGKGAERVNRGLQSPSCKALTRFLDEYADRKKIIEEKYPKIEDYIASQKSVKLGPLLCKDAFPSEDDSKDCPWSASGVKSSSGSSSKTKGQ